MGTRLARYGVHTMWLCIVTTMLPNECLAQDVTQSAPAEPDFDILPTVWSLLSPADRTKALENYADQTQGNYEKLRTWKGTYSVSVEQFLPANTSEKLFHSEERADLWQETTFTLHFAVDFASNAVYRDKQTAEMRFVRDGSNTVVEIPNTKPRDGRSLVTPEHYVRFDPAAVWPGFTHVQDYPETRNKHAAFRKSSERAARQYAELMDPRSLFGFSDMKFWEEARVIMEALRVGVRSGLDKAPDDLLKLYSCDERGAIWYRMTEILIGRNDEKSYMSVVWSSLSGFNPVELLMSTDEAGEQPQRKMRSRWKLFGGVYLPERVEEAVFGRNKNGQVVLRRELQLLELSVNESAEPSQFSYAGLGMKDGDLVMDDINKACYILRGGKPEKLADYGSKYIAPLPAVPPRFRLALSAGAFALLMIVVAALWLRRASRADSR